MTKDKQPTYLNDRYTWVYEGNYWLAMTKDGMVRWSRDLGHGIIAYDSQQEALDDNKTALASMCCDSYYSPDLEEHHFDLPEEKVS